MLAADVYERALEARDPRFDGLFFVGITSTGVYCRPVCPARVAYSSHRRFFDSAAAAECAGFRPCLRCRPELAPGRALCDAVSRLARVAARRIAAGALNGRTVADLAEDFGVSERHLRRAFEREIGVAPLELAQTHRLLLAKQLLGDTSLSVTRIAYASGFQSLRRFNAVFRQRYGLNPSAARRARRMPDPRRVVLEVAPAEADVVHLTLGYRAPFAWKELLNTLASESMPGVDAVDGDSYVRTVRLGDHTGAIRVSNTDSAARRSRAPRRSLDVTVSASLLPVMMPLLARLRSVFDLDAEPAVVDGHLQLEGLDAAVRRRPGLRIPGAFDGFEVVMRIVMADARRRGLADDGYAALVHVLSERIASEGFPVDRLVPTAERVAEMGQLGLEAIGVDVVSAVRLDSIARAVAERRIDLEAGGDVGLTRRTLLEMPGMTDRIATLIAMRALNSPDAFPDSDPTIENAFGDPAALRERAERWRPWRSYAALHLWLAAEERRTGPAD